MPEPGDFYVGQRLTDVRRMTLEEIEGEGWTHCVSTDVPLTFPTVFVFEGGTKLFASCDPEGNAPGALFGEDRNGESFHVMAQK